MTNSRDNLCVSLYRRITDRVPEKKINLSQWLFTPNPYYKPLINKIRAEQDADVRAQLKRKLPSVTPSGVFAGNKDIDLVHHSGMIGIDIDKTESQRAKEKLSTLPWVYYAGLSVSGRGVWALVPIADGDQHREHFYAIKSDLEDNSLDADPMCVNESRKRFYSIDPDPVINKDAETYYKVYEQQVKEQAELHGDEYLKVNMLLARIHNTQVDITETHHHWLLIGGVLANLFGEGGRKLYHQFSRYHPRYMQHGTDSQYDSCLRYRKPYGLGLLFHVAAQYDVYAKQRPQPRIGGAPSIPATDRGEWS